MGLTRTGIKRLAGPVQLGNVAATIYQAAIHRAAEIYTIRVSNPSSNPVDVTLSIGADGAGTRIMDGRSVPARSAIDTRIIIPIERNGIVQAFASTANVLNVTISGVEKYEQAPFSPATVGSLIFWMNGEDQTFALNTPFNSGTILDSSGNGRTLGVSGTMEFRQIALMNNKKALVFQGNTPPAMSAASTNALQRADDFTFFCVGRFADTTAFKGIATMTAGAGDAWNIVHNATPALASYGPNAAYKNFNDPASASTNPFLLSYSVSPVSAGNVVIRTWNNQVPGQGSPFGSTPFVYGEDANFTLGSFYTTGFGAWNSELAEFLYYAGELSDSDRALVEGYLKTKYAL